MREEKTTGLSQQEHHYVESQFTTLNDGGSRRWEFDLKGKP
jgi:hypothetical protein